MFKKSLFVATLIIGAVACQVVEDPDSVKQQTIHFSADSFTVFEDGCPETKTGIGEENKFYWSIGDTVGVYPNSGSQVYFVMDSEEEAHSADFDGGGWAFKVGSTYRSYYPFVGDIYLNAKKIPVRYYRVDKEGLIVLQKQVGNNSTGHIGPYDFMYAPETPAESDNLSLHYSHLSTILKPRLTLPAGHYIKLTMSLDEPLFVVRGEYDLTSDSPTIVGKELEREVSMDLDITLSEPGLLEAYYVTAAPIDMQGEALSVSVKDENGREYSYIYSPSRAYSAGEIVRLTSPISFVIESVSLDESDIALSVGQTQKLSATVLPENAANKNVTWTSSNTSVATIDSNGNVTAKANGTAIITVETVEGGKTATCSVTVSPVKVSKITLSSTTASINVGATTTLTATVAPTNAADKAVTWSSSNTAVATVSSSGVVTGVKAGTATITATAHDGSGVKATCSVTVSNVAVTSVTLNKTSLSLVNGNSETLTATVNPSNATDKTVTWSSSNTSVATVSNGTVTAKGVGTATITATAGGKSAVCTVTVTVPVAGVSLNKTSLSLTKGSTETLTATITPNNATNKNVTWSSSKTSVATVDSNGMVTAVSSGSAIITVTTADGSISASCQVTVSNPVTRIALYSKNLGKEVTSLSMLPDDSDELSIVFYPSDASNINEYKNLSDQYWQSSNSCVTCTFGAISADESLGNNSSIVSVYVKGLSASCSVKLLNSSTDAVDLGLSVKWMNRNVYTTSSSDFGPYYEWNEAKDKFNGDWRLPTKEEAEELVNKCTFTRSGNGFQ